MRSRNSQQAVQIYYCTCQQTLAGMKPGVASTPRGWGAAMACDTRGLRSPDNWNGDLETSRNFKRPTNRQSSTRRSSFEQHKGPRGGLVRTFSLQIELVTAQIRQSSWESSGHHATSTLFVVSKSTLERSTTLPESDARLVQHARAVQRLCCKATILDPLAGRIPKENLSLQATNRPQGRRKIPCRCIVLLT